MRESLPLKHSAESLAPEKARSPRRHRLELVCLAVWTLFVLVALWWLLGVEGSGTGASAWVIREGGAPKTAVERTQDWLRLVHLNFQRIYPWVLFAPYVGWLGLRFSLERGRLRLSAPVHLAACVLFVAASQTINSRPNMSVARVMVITEHRQADLPPSGREVRTVPTACRHSRPFGSLSQTWCCWMCRCPG